MLKPNWGIVAAGAIGIIACSVGYGLRQQATDAERIYRQSASYAEYAADQIVRPCSLIGKAKQAQCLREGTTKYRLNARDKQREYEDLIAQKKSALWTMIMGIAALIGMAFSVVGVVLVWTTFRETRRANDIAVDTAERQLRAYVSATSFSFSNFIVGKKPLFQFDIQNFGETPASRVSAVALVATLPANAAGDFKVHPTKNFKGAEFNLSPGDIRHYQYEWMEVLSQELADGFRTGDGIFIYGGWIKYRDYRGKWRRATFQFQTDRHYFDAEDGTGIMVHSRGRNKAT